MSELIETQEQQPAEGRRCPRCSATFVVGDPESIRRGPAPVTDHEAALVRGFYKGS